MKITWKCNAFSELTLEELYEILVLRQIVFVVEQDCPYLDADGKDNKALHVQGFDQDGELVAYTRLVPAGISYPMDCSIGRVVTSDKVRGHGIGKELMSNSIAYCKKNYPGFPIRISAQTYLKKFYTELGFVFTGKEYLEDNIPHMEMVLDFNELKA